YFLRDALYMGLTCLYACSTAFTCAFATRPIDVPAAVAHDGSNGSPRIASMAILATVFGMLGRFAGRVLTTTLGWAGTLLFGRVRKDHQVILAAVTFGSVVWAALLVGVIVPDVGTFLLAFVPVPDFIDPLWVRVGMVV